MRRWRNNSVHADKRDAAPLLGPSLGCVPAFEATALALETTMGLRLSSIEQDMPGQAKVLLRPLSKALRGPANRRLHYCCSPLFCVESDDERPGTEQEGTGLFNYANHLDLDNKAILVIIHCMVYVAAFSKTPS